MVPALFNLHIRLVPSLMPCSDPVSFTIFVLHCNLCDEKDASYPLYCCSSAAIFVFVVFWWMANKPQFQPKLPFLICLVWYRLRDLVQGGLAVDATRSAIADLVCMRTKLLRWSVFRPHFSSKVSFFPLGCFESPIALPRRQTRGNWVTSRWFKWIVIIWKAIYEYINSHQHKIALEKPLSKETVKKGGHCPLWATPPPRP